jgi:hypothetical protein
MKKLMTLMIVAASFLSCSDDDIKVEQDLSTGPKVVGFASSLATVAYFSDEGTVLRKFPMNLIGNGNGQVSTSEIQVSYTIDPASTATAGVEYSMVDTTGKITIPAGTTFGEFSLNVNTGQLDPTQKTELILNLTTSTAGSVVGAQYSKLRIVFVGCLSQLAGNYTKTTTWAGGSFTRTDEVVTLVDINTFQTRYVGNWAVGTFTPAGYTFIDICGEITVPDGNLGQYSNEVKGGIEDDVPNDGEVTSATEFYTVYDVVPYPNLSNRVFKTFYTRQ